MADKRSALRSSRAVPEFDSGAPPRTGPGDQLTPGSLDSCDCVGVTTCRVTVMAEPPLHGHSPGVSAVIERNINALLAHRAAEERKRGLQEKIAEVVTRFAGSML